MPMSILRIRSLSDLSPELQARNRSAPPDVLAFIEATGLPDEVAGLQAQAIGSGTDADVDGEKGGFVMLDYPVSVNRYWRNFKGRMVVSTEAVKYKQHIRMDYTTGGGRYFYGLPVSVEFKLHPKTTKTGDASKTRMDLDNVIKVLLDALNGVAYQDDKQVVRLVGEVSYPVVGGGLSVRVTA